MNYNSAEYIEQYNKTLSEHCDWEIQLSTDEEQKNSFAVFHLNTHPLEQDKPVLIGYIPLTTPVESLISSEILCNNYYHLGQTIGIKAQFYYLSEAGAFPLQKE